MKPVPGPVEGWTFERSSAGLMIAITESGDWSTCVGIDGGTLTVFTGRPEVRIPIAVVRALLADEALTVGQALADARVQGGTHVVVTDCPIWGWTQVCVDGGHVAWRLCDSGPYGDEFVAWDREWETDEFPIRLLSLPCRIVEDADAPPEGRGSM